MKNKLILILLLLVIPLVVEAKISYPTRIMVYYPAVVSEIQDHGLSGPIAKEVAKFALLRRIHEDGLNRPPRVSMNGMVPGSPNKEVIEYLDMPRCELSIVRAKDGQGCYKIKGLRANIMGAVAIGLWYDTIINSNRLRICNEQEQKVWNESKYCSHMMAIGNQSPKYKVRFQLLKQKRLQILEKVNRAYGPRGNYINGLRKDLEPFFKAAVQK